jgi:hypothetical protein
MLAPAARFGRAAGCRRVTLTERARRRRPLAACTSRGASSRRLSRIPVAASGNPVYDAHDQVTDVTEDEARQMICIWTPRPGTCRSGIPCPFVRQPHRHYGRYVLRPSLDPSAKTCARILRAGPCGGGGFGLHASTIDVQPPVRVAKGCCYRALFESGECLPDR